MSAFAGGFSIVALSIAALVVLEGAACNNVRPTDDAQTQAVIRLSEGLRIADVSCASVAMARSDHGLATSCADAYEHARDALLSVADAKDRGGDVGCILNASASFAEALSTTLVAAGVQIPPLLSSGIVETRSAFPCADASTNGGAK